MPPLPPPPAPGDDDGWGGDNGEGIGHTRGWHGESSFSGHDMGDDSDLPPLDIEIPDDLTALDAEVNAYRAARREALRQERLDRFRPVTDRWHRTRRAVAGRGLSGAVVVALLVAVAAIGAFLPVVTSHARQAPVPAALPLASPAAAVGAVGGLLPGVTLQGPYGTRDAEELRPGLLVLIPENCGCASSISQIVGQTHEARPIPTYLIAPRLDDAELGTLVNAQDAANHHAVGLTDPTGALAAAYGADRSLPTLLLVSADGRLLRAPLTFRPDDRLETWLGIRPLG